MFQYNFNKYYLTIILLCLINLTVAVLFLHSLKLSGDSMSYVNAMNMFQGELPSYEIGGSTGEWIHLTRALTSPIMMYLSIFFSIFTGSYLGGMLFVNFIFYLSLPLIFFELVNLIFSNKNISFFATLIIIFNFNYYFWGPTYMVDIGGWFFLVSATYFAVKYYQKLDNKYLYYSVLLSSLGFLLKEYGILGYGSLFFLILFSNIAVKEKIKKILLSALLLAIIPLLYHLFFYIKYDFSYLDWFSFNAVKANGTPFLGKYYIKGGIKNLFLLFASGWPIFIYGYFKFKEQATPFTKRIIFALLPASLFFLIWPIPVVRVSYIFVLWLAISCGYGLSLLYNKNKLYSAFYIIFYALVNYNQAYINAFVSFISDKY